MKLFIYVSVLVAILFYTQALECGIDDSSQNKELQNIVEKCSKKKDEGKEKPSDREEQDDEDDDEEEEDLRKGRSSTESSKQKKRNRRSDDDSKNSRKNNNNNNNNKNDDNDDHKNVTHNNNNNSTADKDNCIVHCIFEQLGMVDNEGFPVHHRVLNALMNNARGRELRDFVQDTTDECFQLMEQGSHDDPCQYSVTLVNCLAEGGKSNCADWPIGNLPFLKKKN